MTCGTAMDSLTTAELAAALGVGRAPSPLARVDDERVRQLAAQFDPGRFAPVAWDDPLFWNVEASSEERSQLFAVGNAVNFRFWRVADGVVVREHGPIDGQEFSGGMYMWRSL